MNVPAVVLKLYAFAICESTTMPTAMGSTSSRRTWPAAASLRIGDEPLEPEAARLDPYRVLEQGHDRPRERELGLVLLPVVVSCLRVAKRNLVHTSESVATGMIDRVMKYVRYRTTSLLTLTFSDSKSGTKIGEVLDREVPPPARCRAAARARGRSASNTVTRSRRGVARATASARRRRARARGDRGDRAHRHERERDVGRGAEDDEAANCRDDVRHCGRFVGAADAHLLLNALLNASPGSAASPSARHA